MKVRREKGFSAIEDRFTDRKEARSLFWKHYQKMHDNREEESEIQVLSYYGIGGIGKSSLLRKLMEEMDEKLSKPNYAYLDLSIVHESKEILERLRNKLSQEARFSFELFDLALYSYARKSGENLSPPQVRALASKSPVLTAILEVSQMIPGIGIYAKITAMADKGIALARNLLRKYRKEIVELEQIPQELLEQRLPYYFARDLAENLKRREAPFVIFFDTYENMVNEVAAMGEPLCNDLWLRGENGLIQNVPHVLWVIAGREKLKWEQFDPAWGSTLEQHRLDCLSYADACEYLQFFEIEDESLIAKIYEVTNGTPVYLKLCVEHFLAREKRKRTIPMVEDFDVDTQSLIELYVRYMDDSKKDFIYLFSCLGIWEEELLFEIAGKVIPNFSITTYEKLRRFSFVSESSGGFYTLHQTIAQVLFASCPPFIKENAINYALSYYLMKLKASNVCGERFSFDLGMAVHFSLLKYSDDEEYFIFYKEELNSIFAQLIEGFRVSLVRSTFSPIYQRAVSKEQSPLLALSYRIMASVLSAEGKYKESLDFAEKSVEIFKKCLGNAHEETLEAKFQLVISLLKQGQYAEGHRYTKVVLNESKRKWIESHPLVMKAEALCAETYTLLGKHKEAYRMYQKILQKQMEHLGENNPNTVHTMTNIANSLSYLGRYEEALRVREKSVAKCKEVFGTGHPYTLQEVEFMSRELGLLGRYREDIEIREEILKKQIELFGEDHPNTLSTMNSLGNSLHALGHYERALAVKKEVLQKRKEILGEDHPNTLKAMVNLADILCTLKQYDEAFHLREEVLQKRRELFGEEHPATIRAKEYYADSLDDRKCHEEALKLHREVWEKYKRLFGEDHPDTVRGLHGLVKSFYKAGKVQEAIPFAQQLLIQVKQKIANRYKKIQWLDTIAHIYAEAGRFEEAKVIALQNIKEAEKHYFEVEEYRKAGYRTMATIYAKSGKDYKAQKYLRKADEVSGDAERIRK